MMHRVMRQILYDLGWVAPAGQMYSTANDLMKVHTYIHN